MAFSELAGMKIVTAIDTKAAIGNSARTIIANMVVSYEWKYKLQGRII